MHRQALLPEACVGIDAFGIASGEKTAQLQSPDILTGLCSQAVGHTHAQPSMQEEEQQHLSVLVSVGPTAPVCSIKKQKQAQFRCKHPRGKNTVSTNSETSFVS